MFKSVSEVRKIYPYLETGKIYFNHASIGPLSSNVVKRIEGYLFERSISPIKNYDMYLETDASAKEKLGRLLNVNPSRLAWVDNVSNGMNILAQGLRWESGDRLIINDIEFPANVYPFINLKKKGVVIDVVKNEKGTLPFEKIIEKITPKTKLISISFVQFYTGYRSDIKKLGEFCRANEIILSVDLIQGAGALRTDLKDWKVDFAAGGTQKWLMGIQGLSYIYVSEKIQELIDQKYLGWLSIESAWELLSHDDKLKPDAERFRTGTVNALGVTALDENLNMFLGYGPENVEMNILENSKYLIGRLNRMGIKTFSDGLPQKHLSGIVTAFVPDAAEVLKKLNKEDIFPEIRENKLRISPHFYNTKEEIDILVEKIELYIPISKQNQSTI